MALWGNNDSLETKGSDGSAGLITAFNYQGEAHGYAHRTLFGSNTQWGETGHAGEGSVIRIGKRGAGGRYFGDVVVVSVATTERLTVASTESVISTGTSDLNNSGVSTTFTVSELPKFTTWDLQGDRYRNYASDGDSDSFVYGVSTDSAGTNTGSYLTGEGWVGVTTYLDNGGNLRVKSEILVAMSGIATGGIGTGVPYPTTPDALANP
tara:strand:+ start:293 stop:919 length:627 start_codon:yes stop_codon:yes gene_type:complete